MSLAYQAVGWNRQKRVIDGLAITGVGLFIATYTGVTLWRDPDVTVETLLIRGSAATAFLLLHVILCIGPLARLDRRFLPFLYNRRHLGVLMFLLALTHATASIIQFHARGDVNPLVSVLSANRDVGRLSAFPFELLGIGALVILFLMAATSHDFWLSALTPPVWKSLHMFVYLAYGLLVGHVALGVVQAEPGWVLPGATAAGLALVVGLHLAAGRRERPADREPARGSDGWIDVCHVDDIKEGCAKVATVGGERVAVFRWEGQISGVSNVCRHQNGPLGEGRIIDGCITCPWHGYQYRPDTGASPPPFTDRVPTFNLRVTQGRVHVDPRPNAPGTRIEPVRVGPVGEVR